MASSCPVILRVIASSVSIAHRAGKIIREVMKKGELGTVVKGKNDFQTEADRSAQRCINASLFRQFPKLSIFGEEETNPKDHIDPSWIEMSFADDVMSHAAKVPDHLKTVKEEEVVVWVDPLDGTAEYTQGLLDHVTVLIGVAYKGEAVGGVIYQPYYNYKAGPDAKLGRCIWGMLGVGAFGFEQKVAPEGENIITTTRSHGTKAVVDAIDACDPTEILRVGGAGHKVLLVLEGRAHCYLFASPGCKKWDTCAPEAVLHAAGGKLTDLHGNQYKYHPGVERRNKGGVLAAPSLEQHKWYEERIPDEIKDALPV